jgi:hypothetical protein
MKCDEFLVKKYKGEGDAKSLLLLLILQTVKPSQIFFNHVGDG